MRKVQLLRNQRSIAPGSSDVASGLMRILVLDDDSEIIGQLENALWVWPHKLALTANVEDAARLCQQLTPSAILVAVDRNKASETKSVPALRRRLPTVPIVAVVSRQQFGTPGRFFDQGADALLMRDDAHRPTLHDLLVSVQLDPDVAKTATRIHAPIPGFPWRRSEMLGALICDVTELIVDANRLLATWLVIRTRTNLEEKMFYTTSSRVVTIGFRGNRSLATLAPNRITNRRLLPRRVKSCGRQSKFLPRQVIRVTFRPYLLI